jgi:chemotaxis protein CheX
MNSLAQSGVAELGNVITGAATVKFSQSGFDANISPPMVIVGKGVQVSTLDFPRIVVPLDTEMGRMTVHLALRESVPGKNNNPEDFVPLAIDPSARIS